MTLPVHSALTRREAQVLERLLEGHTTRDIAESYGIGHQTVKNYVTVIYEKLGVRHRAQLLRAWQAPTVSIRFALPDGQDRLADPIAQPGVDER